MDFIRKIVNSNDLESIVSLPNELKNKKVEMLILPLEEKESRKNFKPEEFKGIINMKEEEIKKDLTDMRKEWERY